MENLAGVNFFWELLMLFGRTGVKMEVWRLMLLIMHQNFLTGNFSGFIGIHLTYITAWVKSVQSVDLIPHMTDHMLNSIVSD